MLKSVENIVFSGGGQRGFAYIGCLHALESLGVRLKYLKAVGGTSIGALFAFALALRYNVDELHQRVQQLQIAQLLSLSIRNLYYQYGLDNCEHVKQYLIDMLAQKQFGANVTFAQLWRRSNIRLVVIATNIHTVEESVLSVDHTPDVSVVEAVLASLTIPVLFQPRSLNQSPAVYVDGGLLNNFPIYYFPSASTLGLRLSWSNDKAKANSSDSSETVCFNTLDQYLARVAYCVLSQAEQLQNLRMQSKIKPTVIDIDVNISTIDFCVDDSVKHYLFVEGAWSVLKNYNVYMVTLLVCVLLLVYSAQVLPERSRLQTAVLVGCE